MRESGIAIGSPQNTQTVQNAQNGKAGRAVGHVSPGSRRVCNCFRIPANIGYMSGALKHFFDGIYYPCLEATQRRPYALYVHGNLDTGGAVRAVESIATGLRWRRVRPPVCVTGPPGSGDLEECWELGAIVAAELSAAGAGAQGPP
jgi:hypothetical protein